MDNIKGINENFDDTKKLVSDLASLGIQQEFSKLTNDEQQKYVDMVMEILGDTQICTRSSGAWNLGTMTEDDFHYAIDDEDYVNGMAEELYNKILLLNAKI